VNSPDGKPEQPSQSGGEARTGAVKRRSFLQGLCGAGAMIGLAGLAKATGPSAPVLRPPGGQDETRFAATCIRCNKCIDVCPTDVLVPDKAENGLLRARTPTLDFRLGYCTLCWDCVDVCPTGSLQRQDEKTVRIGLARVNKDSCIAWHWDGCIKCKDICKYKAITLDDANRPVVDAGKCNGCGQCEFICPTSNLRAYSPGQPRGIVIGPA
jgi:ferredoxin-type protein NapG